MGALGGGGAIIAIPALIYLMDVPPAEATTASLAIVALSSISGIAVHQRAGNVAWIDGLTFGALAIGGSFLGSQGAVLIGDEWLLAAFAVLLLVVSVVMWRSSRKAPDDLAHPPAPWLRHDPLRVDWHRLGAVFAAASGVGILAGFFGVGGGFAIVPALVLVLGMTMRRAVGTSLLVTLVVCLESLALKLSAGIDLDWPVVLAFSFTAVAASLGGARLTAHVPGRHLQRVFALLLIVIALYTAAQAIPALLAG